MGRKQLPTGRVEAKLNWVPLRDKVASNGKYGVHHQRKPSGRGTHGGPWKKKMQIPRPKVNKGQQEEREIEGGGRVWLKNQASKNR